MTEEAKDPVAAAAEVKRSQSSLELLSNTAAWKNVVESQQHQGGGSSSSSLRNTPEPLARVSPSDHSFKMNYSFASAGDFRKEMSMSFDDASLIRSPTATSTTTTSNADPNPGLPLTNDSNVSLVSSTSSPRGFAHNNSATSNTTTALSWRQHLNPTIQGAFTPPRSNSRTARMTSAATTTTATALTRSLLPRSQSNCVSRASSSILSGSRLTASSDEGESWSVGMSLESGALEGGGQGHHRHHNDEMEALRAENQALKAQLQQQDQTIEALTQERNDLRARVNDLRQLPTGKISQIPINDMLELMNTYGSEVSDTVMPPRKSTIQKASIIRQFRRWNPNFLEYFHCVGGRWLPKLSKAGELKRRREARLQRRNGRDDSSTTAVCSSKMVEGVEEI